MRQEAAHQAWKRCLWLSDHQLWFTSRIIFFLFYSSPSTPTAVPPGTSLATSWNLQMSPPSLSSSTYRWEMTVMVEMSADFTKIPAPTCSHHLVWLYSRQWSPHTSWEPSLPGTQVGAEHQLHNQKSTTEDVLPAAVQKVNFFIDSDGTFIHLNHRVHLHPLHHHLESCCDGRVKI